MSLRRGLMLLLFLALLPITLLSIFQGFVRLGDSRATIVRQLSQEAATLAWSNQTLLAGTEAVLRIAALNPVVRAGGPQCREALVVTRKVSPALANLTLFDAGGVLLCAATGPATGRYQMPELPAWDRLRTRTTPVVGEAVWGNYSKRRVVRMLLPLRDDDGRFAGAIGAAIDLAWLADRLGQRGGGSTAVAVISDTGQQLTASRPLPGLDPATPPGTVANVIDADGARWNYTLIPLVPAGPDQRGLFVAYASPDPERFGTQWWLSLLDFLLPVLSIALATLAIWAGTRRLVLRWLVSLQQLAQHFAGDDDRHRPVSFADAPREIRSVAASLHRMSNIVNERDRRLREALENQRSLTREVHHRVKNNFQTVISLLSLQANKLADGPARQAIDQARRRIGALALVHRLIFDSNERACVSSRELLAAVCEQQQPRQAHLLAVDRIVLDCTFDDIPLGLDTAVPLTLWLVETVNNAFHHGFPARSGGRIEAVFSVADNTATMTVSDNGVGFDPADPPSDRPGGYGLRLIMAIAAQLGGSAVARSRDGGGSIVELRFPVTRAPPAPPAA